MNKRHTIFILVLLVLLSAYLYSYYRVEVFNHSGSKIDKLTIESEFIHKEMTVVDDSEIFKISLFSPFNKLVKIKIQQPDKINSISFRLQGFFPENKLNQVEITPEGTIKHGALGLK